MLSKENREQSRTESMEGTERVQILPHFLTVKWDGSGFDKVDVPTYSGEEIMFKLDCEDVDSVFVKFDTERFVTDKDGFHTNTILVTSEGTLVKVSPADTEQNTCSFRIMFGAPQTGMRVNASPAESERMEGSFGRPGTSRSHKSPRDGATGKIIISNPCSNSRDRPKP